MPGKQIEFDNGEPRDHCTHEGTILDRPGANPVCWQCGEVNPEGETDD